MGKEPQRARTEAPATKQAQSKTAGRLELHAVPVAFQAIEELFELASPEALRAVCCCIEIGHVTAATKPALNPETQGRRRLAPLNWSDVRRHLESLTGPPSQRPTNKIPKALTSRLILTLGQLAWRLASDARVGSFLTSETGRPLARTDLAPLLPDKEVRSELADLALAFVACALVSDAIRDSRVSLQQDTSKPWFRSSNSKVLWTIYLSSAGPNLQAGGAQRKAKAAGRPLPRILGRGSPGMAEVRRYDSAVRIALARSVVQVALGWCPADGDVLSIKHAIRRARHWSDAVLTQVDIWLGGSERTVHGRDDTPW